MTQVRARKFAVVGAGIAGIVCARTLHQAGYRVAVFEKEAEPGGRMATCSTSFGTFDHGAQYFTVREPRFARALQTATGTCKPWSANSVRLLDAQGRAADPGSPTREAHWVGVPGMSSLLTHWARPLAQQQLIETATAIVHLQGDALHPQQWQLHGLRRDGTQQVFSGFDAVLMATPSNPARLLLQTAPLAEPLVRQIDAVEVAPCWSLMLAFPQAMQPGLSALSPQWNAARSTHHRIAWLARESSKPGRAAVERWTVHASTAWSQEHLEDDSMRVQAKLLKAFSEITGIRAEPAYIQSHRWRQAKTTRALGRTHLWDAATGLGACGDWCLGHRVEDAFISGLELALAV